MVNEWRLPATLQGIILHCRVGERRRTIALKTKKIIKRKVFVFIKHFYIVDWPDIFWFAIAELLEEFASALRRCLECGKLFLKIKRQQHCSSGCRITLWRRENPDRTYEIRRKAYVSAVHDRLPGVKVQRRGPRLLKHPTGG